MFYGRNKLLSDQLKMIRRNLLVLFYRRGCSWVSLGRCLLTPGKKTLVETNFNEQDCRDYYPDDYSGYSRAAIGKPRFQPKKLKIKNLMIFTFFFSRLFVWIFGRIVFL